MEEHSLSKTQTNLSVGDVPSQAQEVRFLEVTQRCRERVNGASPDTLFNLAKVLDDRFAVSFLPEDIKEAISLYQTAVDSTSSTHSDHYQYVLALATAYYTTYQHFGEKSNLEQSIVLHQKALGASPKDHPLRANGLCSYADALVCRYNDSRSVGDLDKAIECRRTAIALESSQQEPLRTKIFLALAHDLTIRYEQSSVFRYLDEAISLYRQAKLSLNIESGVSYSVILVGLGDALVKKAVGNISAHTTQADEAIGLLHEALSLTPPGNPYRPEVLDRLGVAYRARFTISHKPEDIDLSIQHIRDAIDALHLESSKAAYHVDLADSLRRKFTSSAQIPLLVEAIELYRHVLTTIPESQFNRSSYLTSLAESQLVLYNRTHTSEALEEALQTYQSLAFLSTGPIFDRYQAVRTWARVAENTDHQSALDAHRQVIRLLHDVPLVGTELRNRPILLLSSDMDNVSDAVACAIRVGKFEEAIEFMESGRGILWNRKDSGGSPLDRLQLIARDQHDMKDVDRSSIHSSWGPVILLNAADTRCDALIVLQNAEIVHVPLPSISVDKLRDLRSPAPGIQGWRHFKPAHKKKYQEIPGQINIVDVLSLLWHAVVHPVLKTLGGDVTRLWWCPTGAFMGLPLHAAGVYPGGPNCLDQAISSYTPTISVLLHAHADRPSESATPHLLAIAEPSAPGMPALPCVTAEMNCIRAIVPEGARTILEGPSASVHAVTEELPYNSWVHFACHGSQNPRIAFDSAFQLCDGPLYLEKIVQLQEERRWYADFAFLTACYTAASSAAVSNADDAVNLALGLQSAGFRSVIGALWAIHDQDGPRLAEAVYASLFSGEQELVPDSSRAAEALNSAVRALRESGAVPQRWAPFVHIGI